VRRKILFDGKVITRRSFEDPDALRAELIGGVRKYLGNDFDVDKHFNPSYRPWRQRLALVPDGDLFQGIRSGKASVVTDQIDTFTEKGVLLKSGAELEADIIITATGFNLSILGDIPFTIDGKALNFGDCWAHRGVLYSGIPNMAWVFGYFRASWTLRADMIGDFVCRLLKHMKAKGATVVEPKLRPDEQNMKLQPWVDPENFNPGYLMRGLHLLPRQGDHAPWTHTQDYWSEKDEMPLVNLDDGALEFK